MNNENGRGRQKESGSLSRSSRETGIFAMTTQPRGALETGLRSLLQRVRPDCEVPKWVHDELTALLSAGAEDGAVAWPSSCRWPNGKRFAVDDCPGEHSPCYLVMPDGGMVAFVHHAENGVDQARVKFIADACNGELRIIEQRDRYYDFANELAERVAEFIGVDIGEHSSANDPWRNVMDALSSRPAPSAGVGRRSEYDVACDVLGRLVAGLKQRFPDFPDCDSDNAEHDVLHGIAGYIEDAKAATPASAAGEEKI